MLSLDDLHNITNLDALSNLTHVGALSIEKDNLLTNIDALTNLTFISGERSTGLSLRQKRASQGISLQSELTLMLAPSTKEAT